MFTLDSKYLLHFKFVIAVIAVSLVSGLLLGKVLFITLLVLFAPLGVLIHRQPISLTLEDHRLTIRNLLKQRAVNYAEIQHIAFELTHNDYGNTLCILIHLKNSTRITIKRIENIILFFIMLQIKLNQTAEGRLKIEAR